MDTPPILWMHNDNILHHPRNHRKPMLVGIYMGIVPFQGFLGGAGFCPSTVCLRERVISCLRRINRQGWELWFPGPKHPSCLRRRIRPKSCLRSARCLPSDSQKEKYCFRLPPCFGRLGMQRYCWECLPSNQKEPARRNSY